MEHDQLPTDNHASTPSFSPGAQSAPEASSGPSQNPAYVPSRDLRRARRKEKRHLHQVERTRIRESLHAGLRDPEVFLDLEDRKKNTLRLKAGSVAARRVLLDVQKRKVKAELANTRDLDTFIQKTSRSRTLYSLVGLGFFRHVLNSPEYRDDHRFKLAIQRALEEPGLAKSIHHRWEAFDREFARRAHDLSW
jgi:hypothetical protein